MVTYTSVLALVLIAVGANAAFSSSRIVGGESTTIEKFPYIVQVETTTTGLSWSQECAATILNNRFVLSAAQCFDGLLFSVSRRRLRGGTARRGSGGVVLHVSRVFNHPNYRSSTNHADITVVEQTASWNWSPVIQSITLVPQGFELPADLPVTLAGWGATRPSGILGQSASTLQEVTVQSVDRQICAERYANMTSRVIDDTMLCTGTSEGRMDSCGGDQGGPVLYTDANNHVFLVGVISWREACGHDTLPSVNTQVSTFTNWIVINALS